MASSTIPSKGCPHKPLRAPGKPPRLTSRHPAEIDAGLRLILDSKDLAVILARDIEGQRGAE